MLNYRLGTVNDFHWELKPVLSYSKSQLRHESQSKNVVLNRWLLICYIIIIYIIIMTTYPKICTIKEKLR